MFPPDRFRRGSGWRILPMIALVIVVDLTKAGAGNLFAVVRQLRFRKQEELC
jgi:hypothetical protein